MIRYALIYLKKTDPLLRFKDSIDWEIFLSEVEAFRNRSGAGRKPFFDPLLMFKILVLQSLYNLSNDAIEYQIRDRIS